MENPHDQEALLRRVRVDVGPVPKKLRLSLGLGGLVDLGAQPDLADGDGACPLYFEAPMLLDSAELTSHRLGFQLLEEDLSVDHKSPRSLEDPILVERLDLFEDFLRGFSLGWVNLEQFFEEVSELICVK